MNENTKRGEYLVLVLSSLSPTAAKSKGRRYE